MGDASREVLVMKDDAQFEEQALEHRLVCVDFQAEWCKPCKKIAPAIARLATEHPDISFLKVDVDELEETAATYNISAMPTFVFLRGGKEVTALRVMGANEDKILHSLLALDPPRDTKKTS